LTPWIDSARAAGTDSFDDRPPFMPNSKAQADCHAEYLEPEFEQAPLDRLAADQVERVEDREPGRKPIMNERKNM